MIEDVTLDDELMSLDVVQGEKFDIKNAQGQKEKPRKMKKGSWLAADKDTSSKRKSSVEKTEMKKLESDTDSISSGKSSKTSKSLKSKEVTEANSDKTASKSRY